MARKFKRGLMVVGGIVLLVFLLVILLVPRLVPADWITDQVAREVTRATGAEVVLKEAQLKWTWGWNLALREGSLRGTGQALAAASGSPNELENYAIEFEEFNVVPALWPLLRKEMVVKEVRWSGPRLRVRWQTGQLQATGFKIRIQDLNMGLDPSPKLTTEVHRSGQSAFGDLVPPELAFRFTAAADTLILQRVPYVQVDLQGHLARKILVVEDISAHRSTGTITGNLSIDFEADPSGRLEFAAAVDLVPAMSLLEPWVPEIGSRLDCDLKSEISGEFVLRDKATVMETMNIDGLIRGAGGVLHAGAWLQEVAPYLGDRQDLMDVRFQDLIHHFQFKQGRYLLDKLSLTGGESEWQGRGWVDVGGNLAVGLDVKLPPGFTPDLGIYTFLAQTLRDRQGRISLPLKLSGRSNQPTVGVDLSRLRTP